MGKTIGILGGIRAIFRNAIIRLQDEQNSMREYLNTMECISDRMKNTLEYARIELAISLWDLKIAILEVFAEKR